MWTIEKEGGRRAGTGRERGGALSIEVAYSRLSVSVDD